MNDTFGDIEIEPGSLAIAWIADENYRLLDSDLNHNDRPLVEPASLVVVTSVEQYVAVCVMTSNKVDLSHERDILLRRPVNVDGDEGVTLGLCEPLVIHSLVCVRIPLDRLTPFAEGDASDLLEEITHCLFHEPTDAYEHGPRLTPEGQGELMAKWYRTWWDAYSMTRDEYQELADLEALGSMNFRLGEPEA